MTLSNNPNYTPRPIDSLASLQWPCKILTKKRKNIPTVCTFMLINLCHTLLSPMDASQKNPEWEKHNILSTMHFAISHTKAWITYACHTISRSWMSGCNRDGKRWPISLNIAESASSVLKACSRIKSTYTHQHTKFQKKKNTWYLHVTKPKHTQTDRGNEPDHNKDLVCFNLCCCNCADGSFKVAK